MLIELRSVEKLRGPKAADPTPVLTDIFQAARNSKADPSRLRVVGDWIQYKNNFREPVAARRILPLPYAGGTNGASHTGAVDGGWEIAVDMNRANGSDSVGDLESLFGRDDNPGIILEDWLPESHSLVWSFNALYWKALTLWEQATGRGYEQALPGGVSDASNAASAEELILELFEVWDKLAARRALPEELHVIELGVGNGSQARVWLDEFLRLDRERGSDYYRRLHYLMGDYSPHVLELARKAVRHHGERVNGLVLDAMHPTETLGFLRYKAFLVYISNVYDNLPTDEIVSLGGHLYRVEVRAYLPSDRADEVAGRLGMPAASLPDLVARLLRLGPEVLAEARPDKFDNVFAAVRFWQDVWASMCLQERFVPLEELDIFELAPGLSGEILRHIIQAAGDIRMHLSTGAAMSFADTLPLLHPLGLLQCHDLFVTDLHQYATGFRGPGKYDGTVVNWVNGPLLTTIGSRRGFDVTLAPFAHRAGSRIQTLTARVRE